MTALAVVVRHDQDWAGGAIVVGVLLGISIATWIHSKFVLRHRATPRPVPEDLPVLDHVTCTHAGCQHVLCFCFKPLQASGQPGPPCPGTVDPACHHDDGQVCFGHRFDCESCELDNASGWGMVR